MISAFGVDHGDYVSKAGMGGFLRKLGGAQKPGGAKMPSSPGLMNKPPGAGAMSARPTSGGALGGAARGSAMRSPGGPAAPQNRAAGMNPLQRRRPNSTPQMP